MQISEDGLIMGNGAPHYIWEVDSAVVADKTGSHDPLQQLISCSV